MKKGWLILREELVRAGFPTPATRLFLIVVIALIGPLMLVVATTVSLNIPMALQNLLIIAAVAGPSIISAVSCLALFQLLHNRMPVYSFVDQIGIGNNVRYFAASPFLHMVRWLLAWITIAFYLILRMVNPISIIWIGFSLSVSFLLSIIVTSITIEVGAPWLIWPIRSLLLLVIGGVYVLWIKVQTLPSSIALVVLGAGVLLSEIFAYIIFPRIGHKLKLFPENLSIPIKSTVHRMGVIRKDRILLFRSREYLFRLMQFGIAYSILIFSTKQAPFVSSWLEILTVSYGAIMTSLIMNTLLRYETNLLTLWTFIPRARYRFWLGKVVFAWLGGSLVVVGFTTAFDVFFFHMQMVFILSQIGMTILGAMIGATQSLLAYSLALTKIEFIRYIITENVLYRWSAIITGGTYSVWVVLSSNDWWPIIVALLWSVGSLTAGNKILNYKFNQ